MNSFESIIQEIKNIIALENPSKKVFDKDVALALGIGQTTFATMKRRNKIPFVELLDFCAKKSISINWLLYGQSPESLIESTNKVYMVKYFNHISVSAGGGASGDDEKSKKIAIPELFAKILGGVHELKYIEAINVSGDSMEPTFSYDDVVFIHREKRDISRGGIFVIRTDNGLFIKRISQRDDGLVEVISDNKIYPTQILNQSEIEVIGKVISKFGKID
ncbi:putative phage repressor [hydrothermal vent metagenome]|uniref:Putative phage repressor n=1 Tax=hydrothermal vent metagenome TaxID=652676 RepID=A0A1W1D5U8_9ZZZZ